MHSLYIESTQIHVTLILKLAEERQVLYDNLGCTVGNVSNGSISRRTLTTICVFKLTKLFVLTLQVWQY